MEDSGSEIFWSIGFLLSMAGIVWLRKSSEVGCGVGLLLFGVMFLALASSIQFESDVPVVAIGIVGIALGALAALGGGKSGDSGGPGTGGWDT